MIIKLEPAKRYSESSILYHFQLFWNLFFTSLCYPFFVNQSSAWTPFKTRQKPILFRHLGNQQQFIAKIRTTEYIQWTSVQLRGEGGFSGHCSGRQNLRGRRFKRTCIYIYIYKHGICVKENVLANKKPSKGKEFAHRYDPFN